MSLTALFTTFAAILPSELPDKTILACLILSSRYRPSYVWAGAAAGFLAQVVLATAVGGALSLLPHRWIYGATAVAFLVGAVMLWRQKTEEEEDPGREVRKTFWPVAATSFAVIFLAEFGDLTQIATASLAAGFHDPLAVGIGATAALWVAAGLAVLVGWKLLRLINMKWLTRGAAALMALLAIVSAYAAVTGVTLRLA